MATSQECGLAVFPFYHLQGRMAERADAQGAKMGIFQEIRARHILNKFPWLWAVRSKMFIEEADFRVHNVNSSELSRFLRESPRPNIEVWIFFDGDYIEYVEKVIPLPHLTWAESILGPMGENKANIYASMVVVENISGSVRDEKFRVFRSKRRRELSSLLEKIFGNTKEK